MNKTIDRIITAKDYGGVKKYFRHAQQKLKEQRGIAVNIVDVDKKPTGKPVYARIWKSQWIADCECKGASFVDYDEPLFFCFSCGNYSNGGKPRPVIFPPEAERIEIEKTLLERPQEIGAGLSDLERIAMARPLVYSQDNSGKMKPLARSWRPGESIQDLKDQQGEAIRKYKMVRGKE